MIRNSQFNSEPMSRSHDAGVIYIRRYPDTGNGFLHDCDERLGSIPLLQSQSSQHISIQAHVCGRDSVSIAHDRPYLYVCIFTCLAPQKLTPYLILRLAFPTILRPTWAMFSTTSTVLPTGAPSMNILPQLTAVYRLNRLFQAFHSIIQPVSHDQASAFRPCRIQFAPDDGATTTDYHRAVWRRCESLRRACSKPAI